MIPITRTLLQEESAPDITKTDSLDEVIAKIAEELYPRLNALNSVVIKKYNHLASETVEAIFQRVEDLSLERRTPVVYIPVNEEVGDLYYKERMDQFYHFVVGRIVDTLAQTNLSSNDNFKQLQEWYNEDFARIFSPQEQGKSLLTHFFNPGANIKRLVKFINGGNTFYNSFYPFFNLTMVPTYQKAPVSAASNKNALATIEDIDFMNRANANLSLFSALLKCLPTYKVAVPGWTIDVLQYSEKPQWWNKGEFTEASIMEDVRHSIVYEI